MALPARSREEEAIANRVTARSVVLAGVLAAGVTFLVNTVEYVVHASRMTLSHFPMGALMPYLVVALLVNPALRAATHRWALTRTELLVLLAGALVGGAVPSVGLTGYMLGAIAAPFYFATPENRWADTFHHYIPEWIAPRNTNGLLDGLFQGLPAGQAIPWGAWVTPLLWWMGLVAALFAASICIAVILRKPWVEHERLTYPVLRPVMELTALSERARFPRSFWIGFSFAAGVLCWNIVPYFIEGWPEIPNIRWGPWVEFGRDIPGIWTRINMFTISFAYFANLDVLFSMWFFDALFMLRSGLLNRLGMNASSTKHASADFTWIPLGAFFALVFWGLWVARHHLRDVWRSAVAGRAGDDAVEEMISYRTALLGLAFSVAFTVFWLWRSGMAPGVAALFVFVTLVLYLGVSRIVSEVGLVFVSAPVGAQNFVVSALGSRNLAGPSITALAFTNGIYAYGKGLFMTAVTHGAKIADACPRGQRHRVLAGILLAFAAATTASIVYTLYLGYTHGAHNFNDFPFTRYSKSGFAGALSQLQNPVAPSGLRITLFGIGAATMSLLTVLKYRLPWWPLHPVGFALAGTGTSVRYTVFSVFIAWAIKFIILRIGGAQLYQRCQPFFLGILAGYTAGVGVSLVVDVIWFPTNGHSIHGY